MTLVGRTKALKGLGVDYAVLQLVPKKLWYTTQQNTAEVNGVKKKNKQTRRP